MLRGGQKFFAPFGRQVLFLNLVRFVPLFPVQENNITNIISFILIRFRLKELKRNKKGQNIVQGGQKFFAPFGRQVLFLILISFVPNF